MISEDVDGADDVELAFVFGEEPTEAFALVLVDGDEDTGVSCGDDSSRFVPADFFFLVIFRCKQKFIKNAWRIQTDVPLRQENAMQGTSAKCGSSKLIKLGPLVAGDWWLMAFNAYYNINNIIMQTSGEGSSSCKVFGGRSL